jgi:hypothetical protein
MPAKLVTIYKTAEEIPEGFADLYSERNGQFELTGIEGVKTQGDIDRVQEALRKEKTDHKAVRDRLLKFGELDPDVIPAQLEELTSAKAQLEAFTKDGKLDETKLEPIIEARIKRATGPLERDKSQLQRDLDAARKATEVAAAEVTGLKSTIVMTTVERTIRDAALAAKVVPTAIDDAVLNAMRVFEVTEAGRVLTKDNVDAMPGIEPKEWFKDQQDKKPHWWPQSVGGNSRGGGPGGGGLRAENPWSEEGWNLTAQGQVVKTMGPEKAAALAQQVGSKIGDTHPVKRAA